MFDGLRKKRRPGLLFRGVADLREDSVLLSRRLGVYLWSESFLPMFSQSIILCFLQQKIYNNFYFMQQCVIKK